MSATAAHYLAQLQALLPPGKALTREIGANLTDLLAGCAAEFARVDARVDDLADEQFTDTMDETIPDWERVFGLPDCSAPTTTAGRRAAILARIIGVSAQDQAFYIAFANALGFTGTRAVCRPYEPFTAGSFAGDPLSNMGNHSGASLAALTAGAGWPYVWILDVIEPDQDDPVISDEIDLILECQVGRINQSHAIVEHLYRLFASDGAGVTVDHNAALSLYHPETAAALATVAVDAMPTVTMHGVEYLYAFDDGANPVDIERSAIPTQMLEHGWRVHVVPTFDSDDTDDHSVYTLGDTSISRLELVSYSATQMIFRLWQTYTADTITGYLLVAESLPITFRSSDQLVVTLDGQTGALIVDGARTGYGEVGDGFLWSLRSVGALHVGKDS